MKHNIWNSLRAKLVLYSVASLMLAFLTESLLAAALYVMSTVLGVSQDGYGRQGTLAGRHGIRDSGNDGSGEGLSVTLAESLQQLVGRDSDDTLYTIVIVALIVGVLLFVVYFLVLTRGITRDLSNISVGITAVAKGNLSERIPTKRQDEIGEIACRVNEMTEEIVRLMDAEREALQTNKELIACVAHDLRTPLTSVIGYLNLAVETEKYDVAQRQHYAEIAIEKANRLQGLIQDLFDYTRLMSGEITLHRQEIDFVKLLEQMIEEFYPLFQENRLSCSFDTDITQLEMELDPELMARAVQNLFGNAVKYGKDGKQIKLCLRRKAEIVFSVTNYGLVIPKESLALIFERFYRVEESRSPETGGTGLGLNIAREIILLHGGTIAVQSGVQGTVFTVILPAPKGNGGIKDQ